MSKSALNQAILDNDIKKVDALLKDGADPNIKIGRDETPIHIVSKTGSVEIAELLLKAGATLDIKSRQEYPLYIAAKNNNYELIPLYVKYGADINSLNGHNLYTALMAPRMRKETIESLLANGADPNIPDIHGETPLFRYIQNMSLDIMSLLFSHGANPNIGIYENKSPLSFAVSPDETYSYGGNYEVVEHLLKNGADPNYVDKESYPSYPLNRALPLVYALRVRSSDKSIPILLLDYGADIFIPSYFSPSNAVYNEKSIVELAQMNFFESETNTFVLDLLKNKNTLRKRLRNASWRRRRHLVTIAPSVLYGSAAAPRRRKTRRARDKS